MMKFIDMVNEVFGFKPKPKSKLKEGEPVINQNGVVVGHEYVRSEEE